MAIQTEKNAAVRLFDELLPTTRMRAGDVEALARGVKVVE
jgi:hypothetical protein